MRADFKEVKALMLSARYGMRSGASQNYNGEDADDEGDGRCRRLKQKSRGHKLLD